VDAAHRGTGVAQGLVEAVAAVAREAGALGLNLTVTAGNAPAQRLYRRMGFTTYGVEQRSLKVGDRFYDDELMALRLDCARSDRPPQRARQQEHEQAGRAAGRGRPWRTNG